MAIVCLRKTTPTESKSLLRSPSPTSQWGLPAPRQCDAAVMMPLTWQCSRCHP